MRERHEGDADPTGSIFWRIPNRGPRSRRDREIEFMIEIEADGTIPREVSLGAGGKPLDITRPGEYGTWNDSPIPLSPPGSPQFEEAWGAWGSEISRDEFEAAYARADATLPEKHGSGWLSCIVVLALMVVLFGSAVPGFAGWLGMSFDPG